MEDDIPITGLLACTVGDEIIRRAALAAAAQQGGVVHHDGTFRLNVEQTIETTLRLAAAYEAWMERPHPAVRLVGTVGPLTRINEGESSMGNPQSPVGYEGTISIEPEDLLGNDVSDTLQWTSSDPTNVPIAAVDGTGTLQAKFQILGESAGVVLEASDGNATPFTLTFDAVADGAVTLVGTVSALTKIQDGNGTPAPSGDGAAPTTGTETPAPAPTA